MPHPEEEPAEPSAKKSAFKPVDSDQFQIGTRRPKDAAFLSQSLRAHLGIKEAPRASGSGNAGSSITSAVSPWLI
jgi:hypothetical protein